MRAAFRSSGLLAAAARARAPRLVGQHTAVRHAVCTRGALARPPAWSEPSAGRAAFASAACAMPDRRERRSAAARPEGGSSAPRGQVPLVEKQVQYWLDQVLLAALEGKDLRELVARIDADEALRGCEERPLWVAVARLVSTGRVEAAEHVIAAGLARRRPTARLVTPLVQHHLRSGRFPEAAALAARARRAGVCPDNVLAHAMTEQALVEGRAGDAEQWFETLVEAAGPSRAAMCALFAFRAALSNGAGDGAVERTWRGGAALVLALHLDERALAGDGPSGRPAPSAGRAARVRRWLGAAHWRERRAGDSRATLVGQLAGPLVATAEAVAALDPAAARRHVCGLVDALVAGGMPGEPQGTDLRVTCRLILARRFADRGLNEEVDLALGEAESLASQGLPPAIAVKVLSDIVRGLFGAGNCSGALRAARRMFGMLNQPNWAVLSGLLTESAKCGSLPTERGKAVDSFMLLLLQRCQEKGWRLPKQLRCSWANRLIQLGWLGRARAVLEEGVSDPEADPLDLGYYNNTLVHLLTRFGVRQTLGEARALLERMRAAEAPGRPMPASYGAVADALIGSKLFEEADEVLRAAAADGHGGIVFANLRLKLLLALGRVQDAYSMLAQMEEPVTGMAPAKREGLQDPLPAPDSQSYHMFFRHLSDHARSFAKPQIVKNMQDMYWRAVSCKVEPESASLRLLVALMADVGAREGVAEWRMRLEKAERAEAEAQKAPAREPKSRGRAASASAADPERPARRRDRLVGSPLARPDAEVVQGWEGKRSPKARGWSAPPLARPPRTEPGAGPGPPLP